MKIYSTPKVNRVETNYFLKAQGTPPITCDDGPCGGFNGADCDELDGTSDGVQAQFFLPGTDASSDPNCRVFVNGVQASSCELEGPDGECEEGANWFIGCDANVNCTGDDTIIVSCDGFQDSEPCQLIPE